MLIDACPHSVDRESMTRETGYKRSTRDAYLQRLKAKELVIIERDGVRASGTLFQGGSMSTNSPTWTQRVGLYVFRPLVALDLYRLFRSWGAGRWRCIASALQCERAGRARWRAIMRDDLRVREMPESKETQR